MRTLLLIMILSTSLQANNWIHAPGGVPSGVTYTSDCGKDCFCLDCADGPPIEVDVCDIVEVEVDDLDSPIFSKNQVTACGGHEECKAVVGLLKCDDTEERPVYRE